MSGNLVQPRRLSDIWGWSLTGFLALLSLSLPGYLRLTGDHSAQFITSAICLFFSGVIMGWLRPDRIWRWPAASFLAFACWNVWEAARSPEFTGITFQLVIGAVRDNFTRDLLLLVPVFLGAAAGAVMIHGRD